MNCKLVIVLTLILATSHQTASQDQKFSNLPNVTYTFSRNVESTTINPDRHLYADCGSSKTCFGLPSDCIPTENCEFFSAVKVKGDKYIFEMRSPKKAAYAAVALSSDDKMGDDSVLECIKESGSIKAYASYTTVGEKYDAQRAGVSQNFFRLLEGRIEDGAIYCQVERDAIAVVNKVEFNMMKKKYYLLIASGNGLRENTVDYHDAGRAATSQALLLSEISSTKSKSKIFIQLHGVFMVAAWIGSTTLGIILARYFKSSFQQSSICGKDVWFAVHRFCMILTLLLTLTGSILILIDIKGWSNTKNIHPIIGAITVALTILQSFIGFLRPHPGSRNRPLFNWAHWGIGNLTHICAIVSIFFATKLEKAELPQNIMDLLLAGFVFYHLFAHLLFTLIHCMGEKRSAQVTSIQMNELHQSRTAILANPKQESSTSKYILLFISVLVVIAFAASMCVVIFIAPIHDLKIFE